MTGPDQQAGALLEAWRRLAAPENGDIAHLRSATLEGIPIEPLYPPAPDAAPIPVRGAGPWTIAEVLDHSTPEAAHETAVSALKEGAGGLALRFATHPSAPGLPVSAVTLDACLEGLDLDGISLTLEPSHQSPEIGTWLVAAMAERSALAAADVSFGLNPVALATGSAADVPRTFASAWQNLADARPLAHFAEVDGRPFHEAGGGEALELAAILAETAFALRTLDAAGTSPAIALDSIGASISVDHDQFLSIAKVRALRLLFGRLREVIGAPQAPLRVHAETSRRMLTACDPHNNLVRATIAAFAAGVGGADTIGVAPYDVALGVASPAARRLARNTQHLLLDEAHIARVADPGRGSGAVEALTASLCEKAWQTFQAIETEGDVFASLSGGVLAKGLAAGRAALADAVVSGRMPIVGVTVYTAGAAAPPIQGPAPAVHPALAPFRLESAALP